MLASSGISKPPVNVGDTLALYGAWLMRPSKRPTGQWYGRIHVFFMCPRDTDYTRQDMRRLHLSSTYSPMGYP